MADKEVRLVDANALPYKMAMGALGEQLIYVNADDIRNAPTITVEDLRPQWHDAETDPPEESGEYIVMIKGGIIAITLHYDSREWFDLGCDGYEHYAVTHWMPLPEPPEKGK